MFTASGKVAGVLPKEADNVTSLALGVQTTVGKEEKFQVLGCKLTLMGGVLRDGAQPGDILNASSAHRGDLALTPAGTKTNSKFNTADMLLDKMRVSSGVQVYEQTLNGARFSAPIWSCRSRRFSPAHSRSPRQSAHICIHRPSSR